LLDAHTVRIILTGLGVGLVIGLALWLIRRHTDRNRVRLWIILTVLNALIYLLLRVAGLPPESTVCKIVLAAAIFLAANTLLRFANYLVWDVVLREKRDVVVPRLVIDIINFIFLAVVAIAVLNSIFNVRLTAFLVTSTVISAVIGLSLQDILGNIFAGLALQIERPYNVNDWVSVSGYEGRVVERNWRTLTLLTRENHVVNIPNATVSKEPVANYTKNDPLEMGHAVVGVAYDHPPGVVKDVIIKAVRETKGVQSDPCPDVLVKEFADFSIVYDVRYWIRDYRRKPQIDDAVKCRIWYSLHRAGLKIPFPVRDVIVHTLPPDHDARIREKLHREIAEELRRLDLFSPLSDEQIEELASSSAKLRYAEGETLVRQGTPGDSLYLIRSGRAEVEVSGAGGSRATVAELGPGDFFGEMSLLTGEPRSATVVATEETEVVVVDRDGLAPILASDLGIVDQLSEHLEERRSELEDSLADLSTRTARAGKAEQRKEDLLSRIRGFFGV
jgi:small-conductance mechanosensitive channel